MAHQLNTHLRIYITFVPTAILSAIGQWHNIEKCKALNQQAMPSYDFVWLVACICISEFPENTLGNLFLTEHGSISFIKNFSVTQTTNDYNINNWTKTNYIMTSIWTGILQAIKLAAQKYSKKCSMIPVKVWQQAEQISHQNEHLN